MDSNLTNLAYVEEVTFGTTPSSNLQLLRRTGGSIDINQNTVTSAEIRSDLRAGRPVRTALSSGGQIPVEWSYGTLDDILEGMLMNSWSSDVLVDGTTKKSYTFEEQLTDPSISPSIYITHKGARIETLSMSFALEQIVTGSFGVRAANPSVGSSSAGTGNTNPTTTGPLNTVDMITGLTEGAAGTTLSSLSRVTGIDINMSRSLRDKRELGTLAAYDIGVGRLLVSGQIQYYIEDSTLLAAFLAFTDRALDITLTDEDSNTIQVEIPKLKYTGQARIENPGVDSDRIVTLPFEAYADADDAALIRFTRSGS